MDIREEWFGTERYFVEVPRIATYTEEELKYSEIPIYRDNNNRIIDPDGLSKTTCMWTISQMLKALVNGNSVTLIDKSDLSPIYKKIEDFLVWYDKQSKEVFSVVDTSEETKDLIEDIDMLLGNIFNTNKDFIIAKAKEKISNFMGSDIAQGLAAYDEQLEVKTINPYNETNSYNNGSILNTDLDLTGLNGGDKKTIPGVKQSREVINIRSLNTRIAEADLRNVEYKNNYNREDEHEL